MDSSRKSLASRSRASASSKFWLALHGVSITEAKSAEVTQTILASSRQLCRAEGTYDTTMALVTVTYLELLDPTELVPSSRPLPADARFELVERITAEYSRFLYLSVGSELNWADRLGLTRAQWDHQLRAPGSETHVLYRHGAPQGYVELCASGGAAGTDVEIFYFGLFPHATGQGLGGALLTEGIHRAWTLHERVPGLDAVSRVWLHTCSLDGPAALPNYLARGFKVYRTQQEETEILDPSVDLWPAGTT